MIPELDNVMANENNLALRIFVAESCAYNDARNFGGNYVDLKYEYVTYILRKSGIGIDRKGLE